MSEPTIAVADYLGTPHWQELFQQARTGDAELVVLLPSHIEELFEAATGAYGQFGSVCTELESALAADARIVLEHPVAGSTCRYLPDFVRFVDDRFRQVAGIRFVASPPEQVPSNQALMPFWKGAIDACRSREVGFEIGEGLPEEDSPGLKPRGEKIAAEAFDDGTHGDSGADIAEVSVVAQGKSPEQNRHAAAALVRLAGGLVPLVRPVKGFRPREVVWQLSGQSPRPVLDEAQAAALVDSMAAFRGMHLVLAAGVGDDPLNRADITDIVSRAVEAGLRVSIHPRTRKPDAGLFRGLHNAGLTGVRVTLHAGKEDPVAETWARVAKAQKLTLEVESELPATGLEPPLLDAEVARVIALAPSQWRPRSTLAMDKTAPGETPDAKTMTWLADWLLEYTKSGRTSGMDIAPRCLPGYRRALMQAVEAADEQGHEPPRIPDGRGCPGGVEAAFISPDGIMSPCALLGRKGADLTAAGSDFATVWENDPDFVTMRVPTDTSGRCGYCEYRGTCCGCRAAAELAGGGFPSEDPLCEHSPLRSARDLPWVLLKVGLTDAGMPDLELLVELVAGFKAAGTLPHLALGYADEQEGSSAAVEALKALCERHSARFLPFRHEEVKLLTKEETGGAPGDAMILHDFDQIVSLATLRTAPLSGACESLFSLLPPEHSAALMEALAEPLATGRPLSSNSLEQIGRRHVASLDVRCLVAGVGEKFPVDLVQTIPCGLFVADMPESGLFLAGSDPVAVDRVALEISGRKPDDSTPVGRAAKAGYRYALPEGLKVKGVPAENTRWPAAARPAPNGQGHRCISVDPERCKGHGQCAAVCPSHCIELVAGDNGDVLPQIDEERCIQCLECVEFCPELALAPGTGPEADSEPISLGLKEEGWLAMLSRPDAEVAKAAQPPAWQQPKKYGKHLTILGLSMTTQQHHGAALIRDGEVIGAVEEERLRRRKQFGWFPPKRPGVTVVADPSLPVEPAFPWRAVNCLLDMAGITMDDVDAIAINGIPGRFMRTYSLDDPSSPPRTLKSGRFMLIPHHLAHAASAVRASGMDDCFAFTVDGRGERETAAFFDVEGGRISRVFDVLVGQDSLIGGVYETVTRILGFGRFGQGSTMGLAALGGSGFDFTPFMSAKSHSDHSIRQMGIAEQFGHLQRHRDAPLAEEHIRLAASIQEALEDVVINLIEEGLNGRKANSLCLAGGVALNCRMNFRVRQHFGVKNMFIQPAAHDAGTALGAALEAHREITGENPAPGAGHSYLGPEYSDEYIRKTLEDAGVPYTRTDSVAKDTAQLVAGGNVVCWHQGRLEFGPRALGARTVLADPRSRKNKERVNILKGRQWWRPFGPSIIEGREGEYFEADFPSPFMLFTVPVRKDKLEDIPAVLHHDNTTRPQSVNKEHAPRYYEMLEHFEQLTGLPMALNTSFNTAWEPIVNTPEESLSSFLHLGADYLAMGSYLVDRAAVVRRCGGPVVASEAARDGSEEQRRPEPSRRARPEPVEGTPTSAQPSAAPSGGRLLLRLTTRCNSRCAHCTVADIAHEPDKTPQQALEEVARARADGCTELVFLRGEPTLRRDLPALAKRARAMGFSHVQVQTNGRVLAYEQYIKRFVTSGVNFFEVSLYGHLPALHDLVAGDEGAFQQTVAGLKNLARMKLDFMVAVPIVRRNFHALADITRFVHELGAPRIQFNFSRPVKLGPTWNTAPLVRLEEASPYVRRALAEARRLGLEADTEAIPFCHLDPESRGTVEAVEDFSRFKASDLHRKEDSMAGHRRDSRPKAAPCLECKLAQTCPTTWAAYQDLYGTAEFVTQ